MIMKKITEAVPFGLLLGIVPHIYLNSPSIAQALIAMSIISLAGYRLYCLDKSKPDYVTLFQEQFDQYKKETEESSLLVKTNHEKAMVYLEGQVKELNSNYGKFTMEQTKTKKPSHKFEF